MTAVPALHGPEGAEALSGTVTGFVLTAPGHPVVYVSGDNASVGLVAEIARRIGRIDIAVLFAGAANVGRFGDSDLTLNARTAVEAARELGDAVMVPVHAEGWHHFSETRERLVREFGYARLGDRLRIPEAGCRWPSDDHRDPLCVPRPLLPAFPGGGLGGRRGSRRSERPRRVSGSSASMGPRTK